jgi:hypothetical protein
LTNFIEKRPADEYDIFGNKKKEYPSRSPRNSLPLNLSIDYQTDHYKKSDPIV